MGWTSYHKADSVSVKDALLAELKWTNRPENERPEIVASATGSNCMAFAIKVPGTWIDHNPEDYSMFERAVDGSITTATLFLYRFNKSDYYNFSYKGMDESVGPYEGVSPKILKYLSPIKDIERAAYAVQWRKRCEAFKESSKRKRSIKAGVKVRLAEPLSFGGVKLQEFTAETYYSRGKEKIGFRGSNGVLCRLMARHLENATIA